MRFPFLTIAILPLTGLHACGGETRFAPQEAGPVDAANEATPVGASEAGLDATVADVLPDTTTVTPSALWQQPVRCKGCYPYDVAVDSQGGVFVGGLAMGLVLDFGDGQSHDALWDGFLVRYHANGTLDWAKVFPGEVTNRLTKLLVGPDDRIVALGWLQGDTDLGAGLIPAQGSTSFVAKYDHDGALLWTRVSDAQSLPKISSAAMRAAGGIVAVGSFDDSLDCFGLASSAMSGSFVLKLDADGSPESCQVVGEGQGFSARLVDVSSDGATWIAGLCRGDTDLGGGPLAPGTDGGPCVLKLDAAGGAAWSWMAVSSDAARPPLAMSVDAHGNAFLSGLFHEALTVSGTELEPFNALYDAVYAIKLDAQGQASWARAIASRSSLEPGDGPEPVRCDVASDGEGGAVFAGTNYDLDADFGGGPLPAGSSATVYAGRLNANGGHVWSHGYGGAGRQQGSAVAIRPDGSLALVGYFTGSIDLEPPLQGTGEGYEDSFVATIRAE